MGTIYSFDNIDGGEPCLRPLEEEEEEEPLPRKQSAYEKSRSISLGTRWDV
jgi:hypothetical protein